ncbi:hypothetical protein M427DRAFT_133308 [Gonapodya prolifera JEL478]|uniref:Uncharacterized protein n=1 Tax=Gonapodya prolifera (strain JEL478) TaxID=1344416 RepID=A0A139AMB0_GONPJ|nr:hypothetical protein M427DRAFT_133308 [Gonapodya prolifera JEL478]|eukprot:KXS17838.1 hypothetical protein M427DRAFT_133308 [Gonapodya prolifera JEL478]
MVSILSSRNSALEQEVSTLRARNSTLDDDVRTLQQESTSLRQESTSLRSQNTTLTGDNDCLRQDVTDLFEERTTLRSGNANLRFDYTHSALKVAQVVVQSGKGMASSFSVGRGMRSVCAPVVCWCTFFEVFGDLHIRRRGLKSKKAGDLI